MRTAIGIASLLLLTSCDHSIHKESPERAARSAAGPLTFSRISSDVLSRCTACHSQYNNFASVKAEANSILDSVLTDRMPRGNPLSAEQKKKLKSWIDSGTPFESSPDPEPTPIPLSANRESIFFNILSPKCIACHNPNGQAKFFDMSTRQALYEARLRVVDGQKMIDLDNPSESYIFTLINDPVEPMPPLTTRIAPLTALEKQTLIEWIRLGLP